MAANSTSASKGLRGPLPSGHIAILGLGGSGAAVARWLVSESCGAAVTRVTVLDGAEAPKNSAAVDELRAIGVGVLLSATELPTDVDAVIASPGVPPSSQLVVSTRSMGVPLMSEIELAWRASRSPWIAVTGTNGKTTTTSLITHLLTEAGMAAESVGNIGRPAIEIASVAGVSELLVAEVSSFQLALTDTFAPRVSVLLNITPDHIDWHGSLETYARDKTRVFSQQGLDDVAVIDVDDPGAAPYADVVASAGVAVRRVSRHRLFPGGAGLLDGMLVLDGRHGPLELVREDELRILGGHNVSNALAAAAAAHSVGAPIEAIREGLRSFSPISHRLEPIGLVHGIEFVNDSKATNPDAVRTALAAFTDRHVVVMLGGRGKGSDFSSLAAAVEEARAAVVVFGEAAEQIADAFEGRDVALRRSDRLAGAFETATSMAAAGDVVLLSPACASFDEFSGYDARGRRFAELVAEYASEREMS